MMYRVFGILHQENEKEIIHVKSNNFVQEKQGCNPLKLQNLVCLTSSQTRIFVQYFNTNEDTTTTINVVVVAVFNYLPGRSRW